MLSLSRLIRNSLFRATIMVLLYWAVHAYHNKELVRGEIADTGFDMVNKMLVANKKVLVEDAPSLLLFSYDNAYMKEHKLFNEDNETNYGYMFHRSRLLEFIVRLDEVCEVLKARGQATPKAFFLDFDLTFTMLPDGKTLSAQDKALIEILKKERDYVIVLAKTQSENFVEQHDDDLLQQRIAQKKIVFASVGLSISKDNTVRRYRNVETFHGSDGSGTYVNANVLLWNYFKNGTLENRLHKTDANHQDVVLNRILLKPYDDVSQVEGKWSNMKRYSVLEHMEQGTPIASSEYENALLMLGTSYQNNGDHFQVLNLYGSEKMSGVELNANTLMTLFFLDGDLHYLSLGVTLLLVFMVFFLLDSLVSLTFTVWHIPISKWTHVTTVILGLVVLFFLAQFFLSMGYWFDWFAPSVLIELLL